MSNESVNSANSEHANAVCQDTTLKLNRLAEMEYESEYARAMALKPHQDLINSLDTARNEGIKKAGIEIAKRMLAKGFYAQTIIEITGLPGEIILQ